MDPETTTERERTAEDNPAERASDGGRFHYWWTVGRGYRDIWLLGITILVLYSTVLNSNQTDDIQESRVSQTSINCAKANETIASSNKSWSTLQQLIVAGQINPGDKSVPADEKDPFKWTGIKDGDLSQQIRDTIPGFPTGDQRLKRAQDQAEALEGNKVEMRNCDQEVANVKKAQE